MAVRDHVGVRRIIDPVSGQYATVPMQLGYFGSMGSAPMRHRSCGNTRDGSVHAVGNHPASQIPITITAAAHVHQRAESAIEDFCAARVIRL